MTSKHIINCPSCFKSFKRAGCYEKHIFQCQRRNEEKIPNNKELWDMITHLTEKYNTVQSEMEYLKNKMGIQNKKIDVLEWLNKQENPNTTWKEIIENFEMKICDLDLIFQKGLIEGVVDIMIQYLQSFNSNDVIRCYEQKKNVFYVFNGSWEILNKGDFENSYKTIYQKILSSFEEYKNVNENKMNNDEFQIEFNNNFVKILCIQTPFESQSVRIKNKIFDKLKENFKSIIELEI
jgi:hypothetical protein